MAQAAAVGTRLTEDAREAAGKLPPGCLLGGATGGVCSGSLADGLGFAAGVAVPSSSQKALKCSPITDTSIQLAQVASIAADRAGTATI